MQQQMTSLARLPQSSWARVLLLLLGIALLWQLLLGSQIDLFWLMSLIFAVFMIANTFENQQQQIQLLQQQVFDLQKQMRVQPSEKYTQGAESLQSVASPSDLVEQPSEAAQAHTIQTHSAQSNPPLTNSVQTNTAQTNQTPPPIPSVELYDPNATINSDQTEQNQDLRTDSSAAYTIPSDTSSTTPADFAAHEKHVLSASKSKLRDENLKEQNLSEQSLKELKAMTSLWEAMMTWFKGGNSIVRIAVIILMIGVVLLLRFASEYWQLTLSAKMAGIAAAGAALTGLGYVLRQKRFDFAISLQGAGLGIIFLVLFSSYRLDVIDSIGLSYAALILLLATTLLLAIRQNALILAFIALGSGFVAPFILNTGSNNVSALMGYYFVLNLALAVIAYFKPWRILNTVALLMTFGIGGFAIWFNATAEQYFMISCWVWAIFVLYLFISIRYSQHIVALQTQFKDVPLIDTTLIFATPFMAFSLYAGLVDSNGHALSIASAVLAAVYLVIGYILHKKAQKLSILTQCFYGLGLVFTALILPFAFDAYWTSVGWAIHGFVVLWLGWRYAIRNAKYFGTVLLLASGIATLFASLFNQHTVLFAASILIAAYAIAAFLLKTPHQQDHEQSSGLSHVCAWLFIILSFCITPYVYDQTLAIFFDGQMHAISLALLLWFVLLSAAYWWMDRRLTVEWSIVALIVLAFTSIDTIIGQVLYEHQGLLYQITGGQKIELALTSLFWLMSLGVAFKSALFNQVAQANQTAKPSLITLLIARIAMTIAVIFLAILGGLFATAQSMIYVIAILPVLLLVMSIYLPRLQSLQRYWVANIGVIGIGLLWLWQISAQHTGQWGLPYLVLLNPVDLTNIAVFALMAYATKPYLFSQLREIQLVSAVTLLVSGLFLISSLMLRMLHHYADLPYWSDQAWNNSVVQACLTILWATVALILTTLASRQSWRYIWMLGIAVLGIVIAKLIFLDLSHSHTLTRIISFIGSGLIMLVIGYFSPLPPKMSQQEQHSE